MSRSPDHPILLVYSVFKDQFGECDILPFVRFIVKRKMPSIGLKTGISGSCCFGVRVVGRPLRPSGKEKHEKDRPPASPSQLTQIAPATSTVAFSHQANCRSTQNLRNGVNIAFTYDNDSRGFTFKSNADTRGEMTVNGQGSRERLRKRLIRGVILSAIGFAATIFTSRKNWTEDHTFGLIFGVLMLIAISIYASFLKPHSDSKR